ncbi:MAG: UbiH/UbiF/VisC/COQ6 family ubiquinone biosynthesis hydroxylase [Halioglobus sp.]|nr:UbiH/UbiF/VisC/COQ6 family ubiquinone biosynthesis hydroxylase [Halioglobus sp.]
MAEQRDFDIVIVGGGIAGLALSSALRGHGLSIALVEARPLTAPELPAQRGVQHFDARVSALTPRSRLLLQQLGAWDAIAAYRQCSYKQMSVWDAEGTGRIEFDCGEVGAPALGHIVENRAIVSALLERAGAGGDVALLSPARLRACTRDAAGRLRVALESGEQLHAHLLVAADGALSPVRRMLAFRTREWDYGHHAVVAAVRLERPHRAIARQRFLTSGPLALLPLPGTDDEHYCSIVWSLREQFVDEVMACDEAAFCAALERASERCLGAVLACSERAAFPLRQRHAVDYVQAGVALVADAAHTIHPLAGQGINLGLQDVAVLAGEILIGRARGTGPGELDLLRRYQRQRKAENLLMMAAMDGFKHLFEREALPLRWLRNTGMRVVGRSGPLKQRLMRHAMGLG